MAELQPKLTYRPKHKLEVFYTGGAARVTRDGKFVACTCGDEVKVIEIATGSVVRTFSGDTEPITALAVSPDCKTLVAASRSLVCRVYNLETGECTRSWKAHKSPVADMAIDASGGYVATASADRSVKVWDLVGGFCTHNFTGHSGVVLKVLFHPKQLMMFSGGDDSEVRVWDLVDKSCAAVLKGHFSAVTSLALSPDGWLLLSGARDKVVTMWDLRNNTKVTTVPVFEAVEGLICLPLGASYPGVIPTDATSVLKGAKKVVYFGTAGEKGLIKLWRSDTATCVYEQKHDPGAVASASNQYSDLALLPGGGGIMVSTVDTRLLFFSPQVIEGARQLVLSKQLIGNNDEVTDVRFVGPQQEPTHLAVATNSEAIRLYEMETLSCSATLLGHKDTVLCMDVGQLGSGRSIIISGAKDNEVRLWEGTMGRCLAVGVGHVSAVGAVALARKAKKSFALSAGADKLLKVWDIGPAVQLADSMDGGGAPEGDGEAAEAAGTMKEPKKQGVLQLKTTAAVSAHDKDINSVAVAPNDSLVATGSQDRSAKLWRLPNLVPVMTLRGHRRGVWSVEFSPVDQVLLTASGDKTIKLWSVVDGSCLRTLEGHSASVLRASYITAGTQVLSAGADGLVKLWSARTGECANTFDVHEGKIWALSTAGANESLMATGGSDALVAIWEDCTEADAAAASAAEQQLVEQEQALQNALMEEDYVEAARIAFSLRHPGRLLSVVQSSAVGGATSQQLLSSLVQHMGEEDIKTALEYCREWNTNSRHCHAAQAMLQAILKHHKPQTLVALPGLKDLLDALLIYTQRHFNRLNRLVRSSFLLDYTLASMKVLSPQVELEEEPAAMTQQQQQQQLTKVGDKRLRQASDDSNPSNKRAAAAAAAAGADAARAGANGVHQGAPSQQQQQQQQQHRQHQSGDDMEDDFEQLGSSSDEKDSEGGDDSDDGMEPVNGGGAALANGFLSHDSSDDDQDGDNDAQMDEGEDEDDEDGSNGGNDNAVGSDELAGDMDDPDFDVDNNDDEDDDDDDGGNDDGQGGGSGGGGARTTSGRVAVRAKHVNNAGSTAPPPSSARLQRIKDVNNAVSSHGYEDDALNNDDGTDETDQDMEDDGGNGFVQQQQQQRRQQQQRQQLPSSASGRPSRGSHPGTPAAAPKQHAHGSARKQAPVHTPVGHKTPGAGKKHKRGEAAPSAQANGATPGTKRKAKAAAGAADNAATTTPVSASTQKKKANKHDGTPAAAADASGNKQQQAPLASAKTTPTPGKAVGQKKSSHGTPARVGSASQEGSQPANLGLAKEKKSKHSPQQQQQQQQQQQHKQGPQSGSNLGGSAKKSHKG